jgi:ABC-2 type transport system ATP-binding protein
VSGLPATEIGELAHALGVPVHHLAVVEQSLEHAYLSLTERSVDYHGRAPEPIESGAKR